MHKIDWLNLNFSIPHNTQYNYYSIYLIGGTGGGRKAGLRSYGSSFAPLEPEEPDEFNWDWEIFGYVMLALSGKI